MGLSPLKKQGLFDCHLLHTGVAEAKATPGNLGAFIYSQPQENWEHFFMVSYWIDLEAICAFAGLLPHVAVSYPGDAQFGLISDPVVLHHEVKTVPTDFPIPANFSNQ